MNSRSLIQDYICEMKKGSSNSSQYVVASRLNSLVKYEKQIGRAFALMTDEEICNFLIDDLKVDSSVDLSNYRDTYYSFYQWIVDRGFYQGVNLNIFDVSEMLSFDALMRFMTKNIVIVQDSDLQKLAGKFEYNKFYVETVLRCFFEGFFKTTELSALVKKDIQGRQIHIGGRNIVGSEQLINGLKKVYRTKIWYLKDGKPREMTSSTPEHIFKYVTLNKSDSKVQAAKNGRESTRKHLSKNILALPELDSCKVDAQTLYLSGILHYMAQRMTKERIYQITIADRSSAGVDAVAKAMGLKHTGARLKYMLKPYVLKFISTAEN